MNREFGRVNNIESGDSSVFVPRRPSERILFVADGTNKIEDSDSEFFLLNGRLRHFPLEGYAFLGGRRLKLTEKKNTLLAILAINSHVTVPRHTIGEMLWPELSYEEIKDPLQSVVKHLRKAFGDEENMIIQTGSRENPGYRLGDEDLEKFYNSESSRRIIEKLRPKPIKIARRVEDLKRNKKAVIINGQKVEMSASEYLSLRKFMENPGLILGIEELKQGSESDGRINGRISDLRTLGFPIQTVRGRGYFLDLEIQEE